MHPNERQATIGDHIEIGGALLDLHSGQLAGPLSAVHVEPLMVDLALAEHAGEAVTRDFLLESVWKGYPGADRALPNSDFEVATCIRCRQRKLRRDLVLAHYCAELKRRAASRPVSPLVMGFVRRPGLRRPDAGCAGTGV